MHKINHKLKIESRGKQNRDFDLETILGKVAISMSMLEIEPALLLVLWMYHGPYIDNDSTQL